jgi:hypothetical protein
MSVALRRIVLAAGSLVAIPIASAAAQTSDAWTAVIRTSIDSGSGRVQSRAVRFQMANHKVRTELIDMAGPAGMMMNGTYMLAADNDSTVVTVMPAQRMAMVMSADAGGMMGRLRPRFELSDSKMDNVEDLGAGSTILGHATRHFRSTYSTIMKIAFGQDSCYRHTKTTSEMWIAPDVDVEQSMLGASKAMAGISGAPINIDALAKARGAALPQGTSMRTISTVSGSGRDSASKVVTTVEITELSRAAVDDTMFAPPKDFQVMNMSALAAQMPSAVMESTMRDAAAKVMKGMCDAGPS